MMQCDVIVVAIDDLARYWLWVRVDFAYVFQFISYSIENKALYLIMAKETVISSFNDCL